ncbi:hypothetical protein CKAH01_02741 [Colletotrichum kahawae]|uniref:Uncharacterized protein n=1 Tax=Colletotrichum kahawae TaxID=34407 RepID=A0AAD9XVA8_COLKA|nr:hypothetical protein CKAH01_02741 [Colletotrichum kahawae]
MRKRFQSFPILPESVYEKGFVEWTSKENGSEKQSAARFREPHWPVAHGVKGRDGQGADRKLSQDDNLANDERANYTMASEELGRTNMALAAKGCKEGGAISDGPRSGPKPKLGVDMRAAGVRRLGP